MVSITTPPCFSGEILQRGCSSSGGGCDRSCSVSKVLKVSSETNLFPSISFHRKRSGSMSIDATASESSCRLTPLRQVVINEKGRQRKSCSGIVLSPGVSGADDGRKIGIGGGEGDGEDNWKNEIGAYYKEMLRVDPENPLLLGNYGKFLHEVVGDIIGAEDCYSRAILETPGDGDVLSLYGNMLWESHRDGERAEHYFQRAIKASPDDCYVLGSYAHFLWDAEEDEEVNDRSPPSSSSSSSYSSSSSESTVNVGDSLIED